MHVHGNLGARAILLSAWLCVACEPVGQDAAAPKPRPSLCERAGADAVRDLFCERPELEIRGLEALQLHMGLLTRPEADGVTYHNQPLLLGHSTSLSGRLVSPINPRAILLGSDVALAFQRGVQRVELAARARDREGFNLYVVSFEQACNQSSQGCGAADLFGPQLERDWLEVALEDDEELKNTPSDCRQCHRRGTDTSRLLMRELQSPWTHFFDAVHVDDSRPGVTGSDLMLDYLAAHGSERYAGVNVDDYPLIAPFALERMVEHPQPLLFDAPQIELERWPLKNGRFASEPEDSPTWERAYAAFKRGEQQALPYLEVRATDPVKQAELTQAYRRYLTGGTSDLPDLADVFPDDPHVRARIGLQTEPDATPVEALIQACGSCHNDVLDQSITRARFNIDLARLSDVEIDAAIERLQRAPDAPGAMPPLEARVLPPAVRANLIEYLRDKAQTHAAVPALSHASRTGMFQP